MGLKDLRRFSETIIEYVVELATTTESVLLVHLIRFKKNLLMLNEIITGLRIVAGSLKYQDWV